MDLTKLSNAELLELKQNIKDEFKKRRAAEDEKLIAEAEATGHDYLMTLASAIRHRFHGVKPKENIGFTLARPPHFLKGHEDLYEKLIQRLDVIDYVFKTTDYNTCDSGRFYRRT